MCENSTLLAEQLEYANRRADHLATSLERVKADLHRALSCARQIIIDNDIDRECDNVDALLALGMQPFVYSMHGTTDITIRIPWNVDDVDCDIAADIVANAVEEMLVDFIGIPSDISQYVAVPDGEYSAHGEPYYYDATTTYRKD